jgi:hypothetical protein
MNGRQLAIFFLVLSLLPNIFPHDSILPRSSQNANEVPSLERACLPEKDTSIPEERKAKILEALPRLNHHFKENKGQLTNDEIGYYFYAADFGVAFTATGVLYRISMSNHSDAEAGAPPQGASRANNEQRDISPAHSGRSVIVKLEFVGANPVAPQGKGVLSHPSHYFLGNNPQEWITNVCSFREVVYPALYKGIDLCFYFTPSGLKYDFIVKPGANVESIQLRYHGIERLSVDNQGILVATTTIRPLVDQELTLYQDMPTGRQTVPGKFVLYDRTTFGFQLLSGYSPTTTLVIDPLIYSTFLGGSEYDRAHAIALDSANNSYVAGSTRSGDFPTTPGANDTSYNGGGAWPDDVFVCKLSADGTTLQYSTFLGGSSSDEGLAIALDQAGNSHVAGSTDSSDFPTTPGTYDTSHNGDGDGFVCKLSADGTTLLYATFLGGSGSEGSRAIALDQANNSYVTGSTDSSDFSTTPGAYDTSHNGGGYDCFASKLSADGTTLLYSTFLGGSADDTGSAIAVDGGDHSYVTGSTVSSDFPTTPGAYDKSHNAHWDGFVCKLSADGTTLQYSTLLGGSKSDLSHGIALDSANNSYIAGDTHSSDFPTTPGAYDPSYNRGSPDVFVCKLSADGTTLLYSTFLGTSVLDRASAIALDSANNSYVTGSTHSSDFPTTPGAYDTSHNGDGDAFVCKLSADGTTLLYSTFLGTSEYEHASAIALDNANNSYVTGSTWSTDFPTTPGAYDPSHNGETDIFVTILSFLSPQVTITSPTNTTYGPPGEVTLTYAITDMTATTIAVYLNGVANTTARPNGYVYAPLSTGSYNLTIVAEDAGGHIETATLFFTVDRTAPAVTITSPTNATYDPPGDVTLTYAITDTTATTVAVYLNGVANTTTCPSGYVYEALSPGSYNLTLVVEDVAGNIGTATVLFTISSPTSTPPTTPSESSGLPTESKTSAVWLPIELTFLALGVIAILKRIRRRNRKANKQLLR